MKNLGYVNFVCTRFIVVGAIEFAHCDGNIFKSFVREYYIASENVLVQWKQWRADLMTTANSYETVGCLTPPHA